MKLKWFRDKTIVDVPSNQITNQRMAEQKKSSMRQEEQMGETEQDLSGLKTNHDYDEYSILPQRHKWAVKITVSKDIMQHNHASKFS